MRSAGVTPVSFSAIGKRDGELVDVDESRIVRAIGRALREVRRPVDVAGSLTQRVLADLSARFGRVPPGVEDIQDSVEATLMSASETDAARAYVLYRRKRAEEREAKRLVGVRDELKLTVNAVTILKERYLARDESGEVVESTGEMMDRVARHVACAEDVFRKGSSAEWAEEYARLLRRLEFLPNSPTLMNAGTDIGLLSACFVLPIEDSLDSIFTAVKHMALIHQAGGGTGFSFSRLRPRGDLVQSTHGTASGPVSFMRVFDATTDVVKQGGRRRGANMAVLHVSHPDIHEFVTVKATPGQLENFNLSVAVDDAFMRAVDEDGMHALVNPRNGHVTGHLRARELFELFAEQAHRTGDPGLLFVDRVNESDPLAAMGPIEATNPCGEVPLRAFESCNLGSVNLARMVTDGHPDWDRLAATVRMAVRFLDDVLEVNRYPFVEIERATIATRRIGVGVMGLAEFLAMLGVPYDSPRALELAARIAQTIEEEARQSSAALAQERGPFPLFEKSDFTVRGLPPQRNAQVTAIAPTGTISIIAGTTSGIEPFFAISYLRNVLGTKLVETNALFERVARDRGFYSDDLLTEIARTGTVRERDDVPEDVRRAFGTALEIAPEWHLRMQAAFQQHVDAAVSKTVNMPASATPAQIADLYRDAWCLGAKGITVYRYGSRAGQVLTFASKDDTPPIEVHPEYSGGCAGALCEF